MTSTRSESSTLRPATAGLLLLSIAFFFGRIHEGDVELFYAAVSKNILTSGEWLRLYLGDRPYFNKPPLTFWATAFFFKIFGVTVAASRMFAAGCAVLTVMLVYDFIRAVRSEAEGLLAGAFLLLNGSFLSICGAGALDGPQVCFMVLAAWGYVRGVIGGSRKHLFWIGTGLGLGLMTKSPVVLLAVPVMLLHAALYGQFKRLHDRWLWFGVGAGAVIVIPWHAVMAIIEPTFIDTYFFKQMADRVAGEGEFEKIERQPLKDLWELAKRTVPWSFLSVWGLIKWARRPRDPQSALAGFWAIWLLLVGAATYSVARMTYKYNVPLFPPEAVLSAFVIAPLLSEKWSLRLPGIFVRAGICALILIPVIPFRMRGLHDDWISSVSPIVKERIPKGESLYLYQLDDRKRPPHPRLAAFYYAERISVDVETPEEVKAVMPELIFSEPKAFDRDLAPLGYVKLWGNRDAVFAIRRTPGVPNP